MAAPPAAAPAAAPANTWKVFVGNLSFKTRQPQLAQEFGAVAPVVSANIITRGPRSLGYGFVEFATESDAQKACAAMNKKQIDGREINVEIAKPRAEGEVAPHSNGGDSAPRGGFAPRARGFSGGRGRRRGAPAGGSPVPAGDQGYAAQDASSPPARGRGRGGFRGGRNTAPRNRPEGEEERAPRAPSATTLFVANLPFSVEDQGLNEIFKEFAPVSAHVVIKRNGRSKGFGFVEFKTSDEQQRALAAMDKKEVQGRALIVRVAQQVEEHKEDEKKEQK
jgi:RNA recognition motif-containing protein